MSSKQVRSPNFARTSDLSIFPCLVSLAAMGENVEDEPMWMGKSRERSQSMAAGADDEVQAKKQKVIQEAEKRSKKDGSDIFQALVIILTQLVLANSADIRDILGVVYVTLLVPAEHILMVCMAEAGTKYNEEAARLKEEDDKQGLEDLGSPHVFIWAKLISKLARQSDCPPGIMKYWNLRASQVDSEDLAEDIRICRARKPPKQETKRKKKKGGNVVELKEYCRFQIALAQRTGREEMLQPVEMELIEYLIAAGSIRKHGTPPKGTLEREAKALLSKIKK